MRSVDFSQFLVSKISSHLWLVCLHSMYLVVDCLFISVDSLVAEQRVGSVS